MNCTKIFKSNSEQFMELNYYFCLVKNEIYENNLFHEVSSVRIDSLMVKANIA